MDDTNQTPEPTGKLSLGSKIALVHLLASGIALTNYLIPLRQPVAAVTDPNHWYWIYMELRFTLLEYVSAPLGLFLPHGGHSPYPGTIDLIAFICMLPVNSYMVGYLIAWLIGKIPKRFADPKLCAGCGYDLTANETGQCPECGSDAGPMLRRS